MTYLASDAMKYSTSLSFPVGVTPYVSSSERREDDGIYPVPPR